MRHPRPVSDEDAPERLECTCSRHQLLARVGRVNGRPFIWIRHTKQRNLLVEVIVTTGDILLKCRECNRWWRFVIQEHKVDKIET